MWIEISNCQPRSNAVRVTSLAEVWIEILVPYLNFHSSFVTSLAEVWIEIRVNLRNHSPLLSLPLRKCGLKFGEYRQKYIYYMVTSLAEVWIEIKTAQRESPGDPGHFPCGSVD